MRHLLVGFALAGLLVSCHGDDLPMLCSFTSVPLGGNVLTLRPDARLERAGTGFVLLATDQDQVLAQALGPKGEAGVLAAIPVPTHSDGPWVAVVGTAAAPATSLVIAYGANPVAGSFDLMTFTAGLDGSMPTTPVAVGTIDKGAGTAVVAMGSGRAGTHAGIAWGVRGATTIYAKILGADGRQVGTGDLALWSVDDLDCLAFGPGGGDLTVTFNEPKGTPPTQTLHIHEIDAMGDIKQSFSIGLGTSAIGCAALTPTPEGYAFAWKEVGTQATPGRGDFFALFDQTKQTYTPTEVLSNPRAVGGVAPPIVSLGLLPPMRYALLFAHASGAEVWDVDFEGRKVAQPLVLPSAHGNIGAVSTQPGPSSLFATYADYASSDPLNQTAGGRHFLELTCTR